MNINYIFLYKRVFTPKKTAQYWPISIARYGGTSKSGSCSVNGYTDIGQVDVNLMPTFIYTLPIISLTSPLGLSY